MYMWTDEEFMGVEARLAPSPNNECSLNQALLNSNR